MALIGLTGGIGAGKSAVARILESLGYKVLSADSLAKEITAAGSEAVSAISKIFGDESIAESGELNRAYVRKMITNDASLREKLNLIMHPRIQALCQEKAAALFKKGEKIVFYEAPLLFEAKSEKKMDAVICVIANDETRIKRISSRDNVNPESAKSLLQTQWPQEQKARLSDYIIENNSDLSQLAISVNVIINQLKAKFH
jgi:dephospho-CoA kinase